MTTSFPLIDTARIPVGSQGFASDMLAPTDEVPSASDGTGAFRTVCEFSHMAFDDPIVFPGQPGRSHLHAFFGNTGIGANSTPASIANTGNSTCRGGTINRSGYWVPAMIDTLDGTPVTPDSMIIYYKTGYNGLAPASIQALPAGLRMIAGDSSNKAPYPQWTNPMSFTCIDPATGTGPKTQNVPTTCAVGNIVWSSVVFPQCWDGVNLDSPDHKSHMAYPSGGACPPRIRSRFRRSRPTWSTPSRMPLPRPAGVWRPTPTTRACPQAIHPTPTGFTAGSRKSWTPSSGTAISPPRTAALTARQWTEDARRRRLNRRDTSRALCSRAST
jgi:hypothetical protein